MNTYVINLKRRPDRLAALNLKIPYTLVEATDGQVVFPFEPSKRMRGHFGCYESHRRVMEMIVKSDVPGLVFEDDVIIPEGFTTELLERLKYLPTSFDIFYLGGTPRETVQTIYPKIDKAKEIYGTYAYMVSVEFASFLLHRMNENEPYKVDVFYSKCLPFANAFICSPPIVFHNEATKSDIDHNKHVTNKP